MAIEHVGVEFEAGDIQDMSQTPTNVGVGKRFTVQNQSEYGRIIKIGVYNAKPNLDTDAFDWIQPGETYGAIMPASGSIYVGSDEGGAISVGVIE